MSLLRGALSAGAVLLLALSAPLVVIPRTIVETIMGQGPTGDDIWIRLFGAAGVALALFHVLILRKLDDLWWWCWAFVIFDGLAAVIVIIHAAVGLPGRIGGVALVGVRSDERPLHRPVSSSASRRPARRSRSPDGRPLRGEGPHHQDGRVAHPTPHAGRGPARTPSSGRRLASTDSHPPVRRRDRSATP